MHGIRVVGICKMSATAKKGQEWKAALLLFLLNQKNTVIAWCANKGHDFPEKTKTSQEGISSLKIRNLIFEVN